MSTEQQDKAILWTLSDIYNQVIRWARSELEVLREGAHLTLTCQGQELATLNGTGADLLVQLDGQERRYRWAPTISEWVTSGSSVDLFGAINRALKIVLSEAPQLEPITMLSLVGLKTYFHTEQGIVKAVDGLTVRIEPGQTLGLVGESGSGKSVTSLSIMGLLPEFTARIPEGDVVFMGKDLLSLRAKELRELRGADLAMIFQEPMTSLNPVFRVGDQVAEAIVLHEKVSASEAKKRTIALFHEVGIPDPESRIQSYPHEMSGGQKQRVMIAMALACNPSLLIADEPTTALDVTIQKQILDLLGDLRDNRGMAILFITHDLGVIAEIADDVAVMYRGRLCEYGDVVSVFENPSHPYTRGLLACRPRLDTPYQILPTVADFLETSLENGEVQIREKSLSKERDIELRTGGRAKRATVEGDPVLTVSDLAVWFPMKKSFTGTPKSFIKAVDGISFDVYSGQTLGLVGESGCGKTTTGRAILRLVNPTRGTTVFQGTDLALLEGRGEHLKRVLFTASVLLFLAAMGLMGAWLAQAIEASTYNPSAISAEIQQTLQKAGLTVTDTRMDPTHGAVVFTVQGNLDDPALHAKIDKISGAEAAKPIGKNQLTVAIPSLRGLNPTLPLFSAFSFLLGLGSAGFALGRISEQEKSIRRQLQIIFQDPYASLNPRQTVEQALVEPMTVHGIERNHKDRVIRAGDLLEEVGLPREYLRRFPHEFSGGQRQRICIARTLSLNPSLIICDESVSALDVSVQAQVLNLLKELQVKYDLTYIFISHDLSVVKFMSDVMAVMKDGKIVEMGPSEALYAAPKDDYTRDLIGAIPKDDLQHIRALQSDRSAARAQRREAALQSVQSTG